MEPTTNSLVLRSFLMEHQFAVSFQVASWLDGAG